MRGGQGSENNFRCQSPPALLDQVSWAGLWDAGCIPDYAKLEDLQLQGISCLCFPPHPRSTGMADLCDHVLLYVDAGDLNTGPRTRMAIALATEASSEPSVPDTLECSWTGFSQTIQLWFGECSHDPTRVMPCWDRQKVGCG